MGVRASIRSPTPRRIGDQPPRTFSSDYDPIAGEPSGPDGEIEVLRVCGKLIAKGQGKAQCPPEADR